MRKTIIQKNQKLRRALEVLIPVGAGVVLILLACANINGSIWFDEAYSSYLTRGEFGEIWEMTALDVHPPFYYFCLKVWTMLFGNGVATMRFMSVFFGCVAIVFAFHSVKRWFGMKTGTVATVAIVVSPILIREAQEMRMYTLVLAIVFAATFFLQLALDTKRKRYWIVYALLVCLGMWTHYFTALAWLAELIYLVHHFGGVKKFFKQKMVVLSYVLAVALYLPWLPFLYKQFTTVQSGFWIPEVSANTPVSFLTEAVLYLESDAAAGWLVVLLGALAVLGGGLIYKAHNGSEKVTQKRLWLYLILLVVPPIVLILLSLPPLKPMFVSRYVTYSAVALWLIGGVAWVLHHQNPRYQSRRCRAGRWICAAVMATTAVVGIVNVETREPKGHVKDIMVPVEIVSESGEAILANNEWTFYDAVAYSTTEHPVYMVSDWIDYRYGSLEPIRNIRYNVYDNYAEFAKDHARFWYITDHVEKLAEVELPAKNLRIVNHVDTEHYTAVEVVAE